MWTVWFVRVCWVTWRQRKSNTNNKDMHCIIIYTHACIYVYNTLHILNRDVRRLTHALHFSVHRNDNVNDNMTRVNVNKKTRRTAAMNYSLCRLQQICTHTHAPPTNTNTKYFNCEPIPGHFVLHDTLKYSNDLLL